MSDDIDAVESELITALRDYGSAYWRMASMPTDESRARAAAAGTKIYALIVRQELQARADERAKILAVLSDAELAHTSGPDVLPAGEVFRLCRDALIQLVRDDAGQWPPKPADEES